MDYRFRWYSPELGRFISPDNIIPNLTNPQSLNRYSYVSNNPINFNDPTGHRAADVSDGSGCDPDCLLRQLTYSHEELNNALDNYFDTHPDYDPANDPELDVIENSSVSSYKAGQDLQASIDDGTASLASIMAFLSFGMLGSNAAVPRFTTPAENAPPVYGADPANPDCTGCGYTTFATQNGSGYMFTTQASYNNYKFSYGRNPIFITDLRGPNMVSGQTSIKGINSVLGTTFRGNSTIIRIEIPNVHSLKPAFPTSGNRYFIPGGFTSGGAPERVIMPGINLTDFFPPIIIFKP